MQIVKIEDKNLWNDFVISQRGDFLQSWEWGEFQQALGRKILRLGVIDDDKNLAISALAIRYSLPFGKSYLYCPHGPVSNFKYQIPNSKLLKELDLLLKKIQEIAKNEDAVFFRIDPGAQFLIFNFQFSKKFNFKKVKDTRSAVSQPALTWQLDISKSEEELLNQMKPKTRYNIRLSQRKGVRVQISDFRLKMTNKSQIPNTKFQIPNSKYQIPNTKFQNFEVFWQLMQETAKRDKFHLHPREHYEKLLEVFSRQSSVVLFLAEHEKDPLAAIIILFWGDKAVYLHGSSSSYKRNLMANYLIHWEAIKEAKRRGYSIYDFGGIIQINTQMFGNNLTSRYMNTHPWQGMTRFKQGFGGYEVRYPGTYDLIFQSLWYGIYNIGKCLLRKFT